VAEKKAAAGTEADMLARVCAMTHAIHKLRQDFLTSVRDPKPRRDRTAPRTKARALKKR
jgi:hypothetical protein